MYSLGISADRPDSAAVLARDGVIVAAAQEERFSRHKQDDGFPHQAVAFCLEQAGLRLRDLERVVCHGPGDLAAALIGLDPAFEGSRLSVADHSLCHAVSGFWPSPFERALVLVLDGQGGAVFRGEGERLDKLEKLDSPAGLISALTGYLGFKPQSGEYKVMGLAPYGQPRFTALMREHLLPIADNGRCRARLDQDFTALFGQPPRLAEGPLTPFHMDIAASLQQLVEQSLLALTRALAREHGLSDLCLAGEVALNCVANGKIARDGAFRRVWIQPAAGDAGGALGAALIGQPRLRREDDAMQGAFLGPSFAQDDIVQRLTAAGARFDRLSDAELLDACAQALEQGQVLGWFQGRMEFGPRSLGGRSILADPRVADMQSQLNLKIKFRESFRPFAPSVLAEDAADWFELDRASPYMLLVAPVAQHRRGQIPAVTHVDQSARVQTVDHQANPRFHALLSAFKARTGCPLLVNTSFNVRGEPIVATPQDAFRCFMGSGLDRLAVGNCFLRKEDQDPALARDYRTGFEAD